MTLTEMYRVVRLYAGNPTLDEVPNWTFDPFLQAGLEALNRRCLLAYEDDTSLTTVTNQQEYTLPTDIIELLWVEVGSATLSMLDQAEFRRRYVEWRQTAAGTPTEYAVYGRKLILHPKPSANGTQITLRGITTPATIPSGGPAEVPLQDHRLLCQYAASLYHAAYGDPNRSKAFRELFETEAQFVRGYSVEARQVKR